MNDDITGDCPSCGAEVAYEDWMESNLDGRMACPVCGLDTDIDDVFPAE